LKAVFDRIRFQLFFAVQNAQTKHKLFEVWYKNSTINEE
jgi:hypothetical protein